MRSVNPLCRRRWRVNDERVKQITYAGATFVTGDAIAGALLDLVAELGSTVSTMNVEIPAYDGENPNVTMVDFVIGPSSEMVAIPVTSEHDELEDGDAVAGLRARAASLNIAHPIAVADDEDADRAFDPDLD